MGRRRPRAAGRRRPPAARETAGIGSQAGAWGAHETGHVPVGLLGACCDATVYVRGHDVVLAYRGTDEDPEWGNDGLGFLAGATFEEVSSGTVSLAGLFEGSFQPSLTEDVGLPRLALSICRGGWPALLGADAEAATATVGQYLDALFEVSVPRKGGSLSTARKMAAPLARNVATAATLNTIAADVFGDDRTDVSRNTVALYHDLFRDLYFVDELHGWDAPVRSKSRVITKPKRYFADPSLPAHLLGMSPDRLPIRISMRYST